MIDLDTDNRNFYERNQSLQEVELTGGDKSANVVVSATAALRQTGTCLSHFFVFFFSFFVVFLEGGKIPRKRI